MKFIKKPSFIRFDVTSKCNLDCGICYALDKEVQDLSTEKIFEIINRIKKFGVNRIIFSGGEPFLRNDLKEIVIYANKKNILCDIVSNGVLIREKHTEFLERYVHKLSVSLDGHNEEINSKTRTKSSFKKVCKTLNFLRQNNIKFNLITVVSKTNLNCIDEIIDFGKKMGAKEHHFIKFVPIGGGSKHKDWYISDEKWLGVIKRLKKSKRLRFDNKYLSGNCRAGKDFLCIMSNGDITICTRKYRKEWILGNIFKDDITEIWHNSPVLNRARSVNKLNCKTCKF